MAITVRQAAMTDAPVIADYALKLFAQHREYDPERFADLATAEGAERFYGSRTQAEEAVLLVAEIDSRVVGFAYLEFEELNYADLLANAARLHDLYVDESARHEGVGEALILASVDAARALGADKLVLSVATKNGSARQFFTHCGLRETMVEMMLSLK